MDSAIRILPLAMCFARVIGDARTSTRLNSPFLSQGSKPQLIAFNTKGGDIDISWDVSVPFFSIPLKHVGENGEVSPLLTVNTRGLSVAGVLTAILTLAVPLLSKPEPGMHYRSSDSQWSRMGDTINEVVLGNSFIAPCIQRIVCSVVSEASHSDNPTSTDKIIDGLSSHKWFKEFTNGTVIQEAVRIGREGHHDCGRMYRECFVTPRILKSMMVQFGAI
ncbi:hypothetical protein DMN91_012012 [Ooceraea biroi]|uniref:Uncharacterized protein n=1 Tax=Ooceraea biroi TaxID=2015173 RepID=A0A026W8L8_OOCBI|nr:uncharacterized protein LOC113563125 [Ooceraea biroi]EZA52400.1 hypothetical protein X777_08543 [Ooceraea biroi]RLU16252.1 hypothetical protein DMN91_012012 [Ooceraea biroi]